MTRLETLGGYLKYSASELKGYKLINRITVCFCIFHVNVSISPIFGNHLHDRVYFLIGSSLSSTFCYWNAYALAGRWSVACVYFKYFDCVSFVKDISIVFWNYFDAVGFFFRFLSLWEHGKRKIAIVLECRTIVTVMWFFVTSIHKSIGGC